MRLEIKEPSTSPPRCFLFSLECVIPNIRRQSHVKLGDGQLASQFTLFPTWDLQLADDNHQNQQVSTGRVCQMHSSYRPSTVGPAVPP